jgi:hypothetical protein
LPTGHRVHVVAVHRLLDDNYAVVFEQWGQVGDPAEADIPEFAQLVGELLDALVAVTLEVELDGWEG